MVAKKAVKKPGRVKPKDTKHLTTPALARAVGNKFWQARSRHGRFPKIPEGPEGAQMLLDICEDYFQWCEDNPLMEAKLVSYEGCSNIEMVPKMRAFTINGLTLFGDIADTTWRDWRRGRQDLLPVIMWAEKTIYDQKFIGAASGFLNATIISRDLGLADRTEISGPGGGAIESINGNMTAKEAADLYAQTRDNKK